MLKTKDLALIGLYTALLIGGQVALSSISGVEIVTLLFASFCFYFGAIHGVLLGNIFSLLRCLVFGFFPNVLILYLIYYNLFAVVMGLIGKAMNREVNLKKTLLVIFITLCFTALFTLLDNVITPLYYAYNFESAKAYAMASLFALIPQEICTLITMGTLFIPLVKLFERIKPIK